MIGAVRNWDTPNEYLSAESDGTVRWRVPHEGGAWFTPTGCAGDIDGDGRMEIVLSDSASIWAINGDGQTLWEMPIVEMNAGPIGCSTFDLDLDGAKEVLTADRRTFYILDGRTGAVRFSAGGRNSVTMGEVPMPVDLDGDGSVEIVEPCAGGDFAFRVWRHAESAWPPGGRIWPAYNWSGTSHFADGRIPRTTDPSWLSTRVWRGQPEIMVTGADLRPEVAASCASSCSDWGEVRLAVRLVNRGPEELDRATVTIHSASASVFDAPLATLEFPAWLDNGWTSPSQELVFSTAQVRDGLRLVAGMASDGAVIVGDCDPGAVFLFHGPLATETLLAEADATWIGTAGSDYAGWSVAGPGDLDGNGTTDVLIGAVGADVGGTSSGAAYVVPGDWTGSHGLTEASATIAGTAAMDQAGTVVASGGDFDADEHPDILVGAVGADGSVLEVGAVYLALGPFEGTSSLADAPLRFEGGSSGNRVGFSAAAPGDMTGDGLPDLLMGAPGDDTWGEEAGAVYLVVGWDGP